MWLFYHYNSEFPVRWLFYGTFAPLCVSCESRLGNLSHLYPSSKNWLQLFYSELSQSLQRSGPDLYPVVKLLKKSIKSVSPALVVCFDIGAAALYFNPEKCIWVINEPCFVYFVYCCFFPVTCSLVAPAQEICWGVGRCFSSRSLTAE